MRRKNRESMPEREHILSSGERIRIRQLSPGERIRLLPLRGNAAFCRRLSMGLVRPAVSFRRAERLLRENPFRALEIVRAVQQFSAESDIRKQIEWDSLENEAFLLRIQANEKLRERS